MEACAGSFKTRNNNKRKLKLIKKYTIQYSSIEILKDNITNKFTFSKSEYSFSVMLIKINRHAFWKLSIKF